MADMIVKLYELDNNLTKIKDKDIIIRKPIGPEKHIILGWIEKNFSRYWVSEADMALSNNPKTIFIAIKDRKIVGFACYDATTLGFFGPIGVDSNLRGKGVGKKLLITTLLDMKAKGYAYAIIPTDQFEFYEKTVGAIVIPNSDDGIYKDMLI